jgi:hypothetical protein
VIFGFFGNNTIHPLNMGFMCFCVTPRVLRSTHDPLDETRRVSSHEAGIWSI